MADLPAVAGAGASLPQGCVGAWPGGNFENTFRRAAGRRARVSAVGATHYTSTGCAGEFAGIAQPPALYEVVNCRDFRTGDEDFA